MTTVGDLGWVPSGYRVIPSDTAVSVECERGCGWRLRANTLAALPAEARDQLFRFHEEWHTTR